MELTLIVITLLSTTLAVAMSFVAWQAARNERLRSEARVAMLAADIRSTDADLPLGVVGVAMSNDLFASAQPEAARSRLAVVVGAGALVVGLAAALVVVSSRPDRSATGSIAAGTGASSSRLSAESVAGPASPAEQALELVALGHERHNDSLTIRGVVRNPPRGTSMNQVTAVVMLFNREGGFLASGRAAVQETSLGPGAESTFVVTVTGVHEVGRYRVSFRTDDRIVPHVDRRS